MFFSTRVSIATSVLQPTNNPLVDLAIISSVASNISAPPDSNSSTSTLKTLPQPSSSTKITIHGYLPVSDPTNHPPQRHHARTNSSKSTPNNTRQESVLLTLHPQSQSLASEWLDGLLMLLNQQPITSETNKLIGLVSQYGLKIRLLNVRFDDGAFRGEEPEVPGREGLDEDYYYDIIGGT